MKFPQFKYNCLNLTSIIPSFFILFRTPTFDPCFINNKGGNYHSGCNVKIFLEIGINKETGY